MHLTSMLPEFSINFQLKITVLSRGPGRCCSSLLGNDYPCPCWARRLAADHRRSAHGLLPRILPEHLRLLFLPIRRLSPYIPATHVTCGQIWLSRGARAHAHPVRLLLARIRLGGARGRCCSGAHRCRLGKADGGTLSDDTDADDTLVKGLAIIFIHDRWCVSPTILQADQHTLLMLMPVI
jgi:hypothetical protein